MTTLFKILMRLFSTVLWMNANEQIYLMLLLCMLTSALLEFAVESEQAAFVG